MLSKEERKLGKEERKLGKEERKLSKEERKLGKEERKLSKEERKKKKTQMTWVIWSGLVLVVLAFFLLTSKPIELDERLCPSTDSLKAGQVVVLIDPTTELTAPQVGDAKAAIRRELDSKAERTEILLYSISRNADELTPRQFHTCIPQHPDSMDASDRFSKNRDSVATQYDEQFLKPLEAKIDAMLGEAEAERSPILKTLQHISVSAFRNSRTRPPYHLLVVSDMIQNSLDYSFFGDPIDFQSLSEKPDYPTIRAEFRDLSVTVFLLSRGGDEGRIQRRGIEEFWNEYFLDQGADEPDWIRVTG